MVGVAKGRAWMWFDSVLAQNFAGSGADVGKGAVIVKVIVDTPAVVLGVTKIVPWAWEVWWLAVRVIVPEMRNRAARRACDVPTLINICRVGAADMSAVCASTGKYNQAHEQTPLVMCACARVCVFACLLACLNMLVRVHARARAHTHTHAHTHAQ